MKRAVDGWAVVGRQKAWAVLHCGVRRLGFLLFTMLLAAVVGGGPARATEHHVYRLGVFPYLPVHKIDRIYGPIAAQFAEDLGRPVMLKTKPTFEKFVEELAKQTYDIVLVHPFFYVEARDKYGYEPLARMKEPLTAAIMVHEGSPAQKLEDLEGMKVGLPPELSAVSELAKTALIDRGLMPGLDVTLEHYRSKSSCLQAVAIGRADGCGLPRFALKQLDPQNELGLRVLYETPPVSGFVFAARASMPEADRINICKSILAWPFTAKGRQILAGGSWTSFVPARDQDYDEIRRYAQRLRTFAQR